MSIYAVDACRYFMELQKVLYSDRELKLQIYETSHGINWNTYLQVYVRALRNAECFQTGMESALYKLWGLILSTMSYKQNKAIHSKILRLKTEFIQPELLLKYNSK